MKLDIEAVHAAARRDVRVCCDENHAHTALNGCLVGDEHAVNVCKLCEYIFETDAVLLNWCDNVALRRATPKDN